MTESYSELQNYSYRKSELT